MSKHVKYTVFFDQVNRTNFQVVASNEEEARTKGRNLYRKHIRIPSSAIQAGWIEEKVPCPKCVKGKQETSK